MAGLIRNCAAFLISRTEGAACFSSSDVLDQLLLFFERGGTRFRFDELHRADRFDVLECLLVEMIGGRDAVAG